MPDIVWRIHREPTVDSTNTHASSLIQNLWNQNQSPHGHVILADRQTAGRAQHGRTWESPPGGVYMSIILEDLPLILRDKLALFAGVAVARSFVLNNIPHVGLRWPNDITLGGGGADKKVAGILCESLALGPRYAAILGIGINVNTQLSDLTPGVQRLATSLALHTGKSYIELAIACRVFTPLSDLLKEIQAQGLPALIARARGFDSLLGKSLEISDGSRSASGIAAGLTDAGHLLLNTPDGPLQFPTGTLTALAGQRLR
jgi:BirA family transcriptional regulator, biotin operon repressor / biotin---[acetyl-CoA-carboxylase] ligase